MSGTFWALTIETERLILRSQESSDYESWYAGFAGRLPQQYKYDVRLPKLWFVAVVLGDLLVFGIKLF